MNLDDLKGRVAQEQEAAERSRRAAEEKRAANKAPGSSTNKPEKRESLSAFEYQLDQYQDALIDRPIRQFGYEVFTRNQPHVTDAPVGKDYLIGPGDDLIVSVWGNIDLDFQNVVDRDGQLRLPQVGPVPLKGLTLDQAEEVLTRRFDRLYKNYELQLQVGRLRDISIHVIGRISEPGRQRIQSDATLLDALIQAGGVNKDGSLRNILIRRKGEDDRRIDLYEYLLDGDLETDVVLRANDVIVIPAVGPRVAAVGRVLRPAIYELKGEKAALSSILKMTGGFARMADRSVIQTESVGPGGLTVRTINLTKQSAKSVEVGDGDVIIARSLTPRVENVVYLSGNVSLPGRYAFVPGMRVSDLVDTNALVEAGFWRRRQSPRGPNAADHPNNDSQRNSGTSDRNTTRSNGKDYSGGNASLRQGTARATPSSFSAAEGRTAKLGKILKGKDRRTVFDVDASRINGFGDPDSDTSTTGRSIEGEDFPEPFLKYALIRRMDPRTRQESRIAFHLGKAILEQDPKENLHLQPQDTIIVFPKSQFEIRRQVLVSGAVNKPGHQSFFSGMRIRDLIRMAGGLLPEAHLSSGVLTRVYPDQEGARLEHLEVNLQRVMDGEDDANIELKSEDALVIKVVPEYRTTIQVTIEGEVRHPGSYSLIPGERLTDLLARAGGYTNSAYLPAAQLYRESVKALQKERLEESLQRLEIETKLASQQFVSESAALGNIQESAIAEQVRVERIINTIRNTPPKGRMVVRMSPIDELRDTREDIEIKDGDRLLIPRRPDEVYVLGSVFNQTALLHDESLMARDYIGQCGGPTQAADVERVFIIRADGSTVSEQNFKKSFLWDSTVGRFAKADLQTSKLGPGDTVVVPYDIEPKLSNLGLTTTLTTVLFQAILATGVVIAAI
jgi:polysaccharide export outer membrane protein